MIVSMMLAGIRVRDEDVRELAGLVDKPTATVLRNAVERETVIVALSIEDRESTSGGCASGSYSPDTCACSRDVRTASSDAQ
jgi:hypothetical protein